VKRTLVLIAILATTACRARERGEIAPNAYVRTLEPLLEDFLRRQKIPGFAIGVVEDGRVVYERGFGVLSVKNKEPVTPRSLFHMASITKPFVATAVMKLVENGRMSLDASITTYLPYFKMADARAEQITIHQLLTHTSGMPDVGDYAWDRPEYDDGALERYVRSLADLKLVFAPGERFQYSNIGYEVLGDAASKAAGTTFEDYVHTSILQPLGMSDSTLLVKEANPGAMTWGHELDGQGLPVASRVYPYNRAHTPSSNLHSNVRDMARWAIANLDGGLVNEKRILDRATLERMWSPAREISTPDPNTRRQAIGLSWFLGQHRGRRIVSHGGGDTGYLTDLVLVPEGRKAVVWMANVDFIGSAPVTRAVLDVALGLKPEPIASKRSAGRLLIATYRERGLGAALDQYASLQSAGAELYELGEDELNTFGYFLIGEKRVDEALRVLQLNAEAFPTSANAQDSLGEAYEIAGNAAAARVAYERALKLDPDFRHAADALAKLR
jgi:CubicO group peptidase (beta-lactamase class C family)